MKIKLLIATDDSDYAEHLSYFISGRHADVIDVSVSRTQERLRELLKTHRFDAALLEAPLIGDTDLKTISLPLLLWADGENNSAESAKLPRIKKYQRISSIVADVLGKYSKISADRQGFDSERARITAVWSPAGGVGKTTVALALAVKKAAEGKQVLYLNMESFSSVPAYFPESDKSISTVFEMLENSEGNVEMLIRSVCHKDSGGIAYLNRPDNFDDMYILSADNVATLIRSCAGVTEDLIIDLPCACDRRTRQVFTLADKVLLVIDQTCAAKVKLSQFTSQHDVFSLIRNKTTLVANKGATVSTPPTDTIVALPFMQSSDHVMVYKALSASF